LVKDQDAQEQLVATALELIQNDKRLKQLSKNVLTLAQTDSATRIAQEVIRLASLPKRINA